MGYSGHRGIQEDSMDTVIIIDINRSNFCRSIRLEPGMEGRGERKRTAPIISPPELFSKSVRYILNCNKIYKKNAN